jgi:hypothetical protein
MVLVLRAWDLFRVSSFVLTFRLGFCNVETNPRSKALSHQEFNVSPECNGSAMTVSPPGTRVRGVRRH